MPWWGWLAAGFGIYFVSAVVVGGRQARRAWLRMTPEQREAQLRENDRRLTRWARSMFP